MLINYEKHYCCSFQKNRIQNTETQKPCFKIRGCGPQMGYKNVKTSLRPALKLSVVGHESGAWATNGPQMGHKYK